ncbi:MAG TPA: GNAT family N-acetyltransferase [Herpetosiphonaceae bacterium]
MSDLHHPIRIRSCVADDAAAFRDLRLEALRSQPEAFSADYATDEQEPLSFWAERASHTADDPEQTIYFAAADETLVGMCGIRLGFSPKTRHSAIIWGVYVRPPWRGQRLADRLIAASLAWAEQRQVQVVKLAVVTTNIAAIRCYARCGFTTYGVEPQAICYDGQCYDELLMARRL